MKLNDIFYMACLIEYVSRETKNRRGDVVECIGRDAFHRLTDLADVNHCLPFSQVSDEIIKRFDIKSGDYDTVAECRYDVPTYTEIGAVYRRLVKSIESDENKWTDTLYDILTSGFADMISDFNAAWYNASTDGVAYYYKEYLAHKN